MENFNWLKWCLDALFSELSLTTYIDSFTFGHIEYSVVCFHITTQLVLKIRHFCHSRRNQKQVTCLYEKHKKYLFCFLCLHLYLNKDITFFSRNVWQSTWNLWNGKNLWKTCCYAIFLWWTVTNMKRKQKLFSSFPYPNNLIME